MSKGVKMTGSGYIWHLKIFDIITHSAGDWEIIDERRRKEDYTSQQDDIKTWLCYDNTRFLYKHIAYKHNKAENPSRHMLSIS